MNHREFPHPSEAARKALVCLSLLLGVLTPHRVDAIPRRPVITLVERGAEFAPYLRVTGAPPLRFQEPVSVADPHIPVSPGLSESGSASTTSTPNQAMTDASLVTAATPSANETTAHEEPAAPDSISRPVKTPAPILTDEMRPVIRPEDFVPYFQFPGTARRPGDVTVIVPGTSTPPAPAAALPPSSATYTQTPK